MSIVDGHPYLHYMLCFAAQDFIVSGGDAARPTFLFIFTELGGERQR